MKSRKRNLLESYVCGFATGLSITGLAFLIYLRAALEINIIGPAHPDYGWVTFILGTKNPDGDWYGSMVGYVNTFIVVLILAIFFSILLSILTLKEANNEKANQNTS